MRDLAIIIAAAAITAVMFSLFTVLVLIAAMKLERRRELRAGGELIRGWWDVEDARPEGE
jgi:hypothetical protein